MSEKSAQAANDSKNTPISALNDGIKQVEYDATANIHQRIRKVLLAVSHVYKNEIVEMTAEKSYTATTHDDVMRVLHMPIAQAGMIIRPIVKEMNHSEFEIEKKSNYNNGGSYKTKWYRTDLHLELEFINVDNPEQVYKVHTSSYAMDTSDKAPAKAFSLAMKILLLKVFLLESRDKEEQRDFERISGNGVDSFKDVREKLNQQQNQGQRQNGQKQNSSAQTSSKPNGTLPPTGQQSGSSQAKSAPPSRPADPLANRAASSPLTREDLPTTGGLSEPPLLNTSEPIDAASGIRSAQLPPVAPLPPSPPAPNAPMKSTDIQDLIDFGRSVGVNDQDMLDVLQRLTNQKSWNLTNFQGRAVHNAFASWSMKKQ